MNNNLSQYLRGRTFLYRKKGFTLVELLVVISIIAILATVSIIGYTKFIEKADGTQKIVDDYNDKLNEIIDNINPRVVISTLDLIPEEIRSDDKAEVIIDGNVLYVVGKGEMDNYTYASLPTYLSNDVTKIIVQDEISAIGDFAFFNMTGVKEVYLPSSVKKIGKYAFYKENNLERINTADLKEIEMYAFYGCSKLSFSTEARCKTAAIEFLGDAQNAFARSLEKVNALK